MLSLSYCNCNNIIKGKKRNDVTIIENSLPYYDEESSSVENGFEIVIGIQLFVAILMIIFHSITITSSHKKIIVIPALGLISAISHMILFFAFLTSGYKKHKQTNDFSRNLTIVYIFVVTQIIAAIINIALFVKLFDTSPTSLILILFTVIVFEIVLLILVIRLCQKNSATYLLKTDVV